MTMLAPPLPKPLLIHVVSAVGHGTLAVAVSGCNTAVENPAAAPSIAGGADTVAEATGGASISPYVPSPTVASYASQSAYNMFGLSVDAHSPPIGNDFSRRCCLPRPPVAEAPPNPQNGRSADQWSLWNGCALARTTLDLATPDDLAMPDDLVTPDDLATADDLGLAAVLATTSDRVTTLIAAWAASCNTFIIVVCK